MTAPRPRVSPLRRRMIEDMTVRNLSPATQRSYLHAVAKFSRYFSRSPDRLDIEDVRAFQVFLVSQKISWPALNQTVCALRFVQARPAEVRIAAHRAPAGGQAGLAVSFGIAREQERVRVARAGQCDDERSRGRTEWHPARSSLAIGQRHGVIADVAPAAVEHFAAPTPGERQQADGGNRLGPLALVGVERAAEPFEVAGVEEARDGLARVPGDAEARVGAGRAPAPFLGAEHHGAQNLEGSVGRAGPIPAGSVEPGGNILGADAINRHPAEGGQDARPEVDAHGLAA